MISEEKPESVAICFAQGHKEKLVIEQVQHEGLVDMLFRSGYRLGKIETWISWQKLCDYQVLVIGSPQEGKIEETEIKAIVEFVNSGGSLFLIADEGGDAKAKSNLNDVAKEFGFTFTPGIIVDTVDYAEKQEYILPRITARHFITREVSQIVYASGCDIDIKDERITILVKSGPHAMRNLWKDGEWGQPEPAPDCPLIIVKRHGQGKVVACGNFSIITSISRIYGLFAASNFTLVGNIFAWLANKKAEDVSSKSDVVHLNIAVEEDLFYWMEGEIKDKQRFESINALVNFALNAVKQSFDNLETGEMETSEGSGTDDEPVMAEPAAKSATGNPEKLAGVEPVRQPALAKETPAVKQSTSQKPAGQKPGSQKQQGKGYPQQGRRPGRVYKPPERNLVFKAKPEAIEAVKKLKPSEQKPAKPAEKGN
ncbi:MAG: hypothetical protein Q6373_008765 [Candidatus Sigynarchaeota archaeon]